MSGEKKNFGVEKRNFGWERENGKRNKRLVNLVVD